MKWLLLTVLVALSGCQEIADEGASEPNSNVEGRNGDETHSLDPKGEENATDPAAPSGEDTSDNETVIAGNETPGNGTMPPPGQEEVQSLTYTWQCTMDEAGLMALDGSIDILTLRRSAACAEAGDEQAVYRHALLELRWPSNTTTDQKAILRAGEITMEATHEKSARLQETEISLEEASFQLQHTGFADDDDIRVALTLSQAPIDDGYALL